MQLLIVYNYFQAGGGPGVAATCFGRHPVMGGDSVAMLHQVYDTRRGIVYAPAPFTPIFK